MANPEGPLAPPITQGAQDAPALQDPLASQAPHVLQAPQVLQQPICHH